MMLHIQYKNGEYDYVNQRMLDALINKEAIKEFYRPQEKKWVNINIDSIRRGWPSLYVGLDRRQLTL